MPITPEELKKLRNSLSLTQTEAADTVLVTLRTWQNWEAKKGTTNHRVIPEGMIELFCLKRSIPYNTLDKNIHIRYK